MTEPATTFRCSKCDHEIPQHDVRAAAALLGGFTWEDVDTLRNVASSMSPADPVDVRWAKELHELVDRIAALLPPR